VHGLRLKPSIIRSINQSINLVLLPLVPRLDCPDRSLMFLSVTNSLDKMLAKIYRNRVQTQIDAQSLRRFPQCITEKTEDIDRACKYCNGNRLYRGQGSVIWDTVRLIVIPNLDSSLADIYFNSQSTFYIYLVLLINSGVG
jgi:hypothetical protein